MREQLETIVSELAHAWNSGDAQRYASVFAADAEQINIFGTQLHGRHEIAERHAAIFETIFRGSSNTFGILSARAVAPDVLIACVSSTVAVPSGPLKGELRTVASVVLGRAESGKHEILLFHNTRVSPDAL